MALEPVGLRAVFETTEFQRGMTIYNNGVMNVNNASQKTADTAKKNSQQVDQSWTKSFKKVAAAAVTVIAAYKAVTAATQKVAEATQLAARVEMLGVALEVVGKNAGYSQAQINSFEKAIQKQGITTQASRQALLQMGQAQVDFARGADLARVAQDAAVIANINSSQAFENMIYGIQTGNRRVLRTMGINVSFQRSYERLAAQMGVTTDALTEQDKVQARVNAVMEAGERISGTYEAALGTVGKQVTSLARHQEESMLILGNIFTESYGRIVAAQTEALKGFRAWAAENEEGLEALSKSFATLTEEALGVGQSLFALTETDLTEFLDKLKTVTDKIGEALYYLKQWIAFAHAGVEMYREAGKAVVEEIGESILRGGQDLEDVSVNIATRAAGKFEETLRKHYPEAAEKAVKEAQEAGQAAMEEMAPEVPEWATKAAEALSDALDKVQKVQRDHYRRLAQMEVEQNRARARAQARYYRSVEKQEIAGERRLAQITERYQKRRAKTIKDAEKAIARAERDAFQDRARQVADFERQERHARERYQLDRIQSERRYQYEWGRALAEGDALALYELQEQHKLEQAEAKENEELRRRQGKENQVAQIQEAGEAARQQIEDLRSQLQEQLMEQDENYHAQIEKQKQANEERLLEMSVNFQEQQALQDENNALARQKAEENYRRQLEELGYSLRDQEELQELGAEKVAAVLEEYYGEGGVADQIMAAYYAREINRAIITAEALAGIAAATPAIPLPGGMSEGVGWTGVQEMQHGGVLHGPALAYVEPGMVEAFIPLGRTGGTMNVTGNVGVGWTGGLESASPAMINRIAAQVGKRIFNDLNTEIKLRRAGQ